MDRDEPVVGSSRAATASRTLVDETLKPISAQWRTVDRNLSNASHGGGRQIFNETEYKAVSRRGLDFIFLILIFKTS